MPRGFRFGVQCWLARSRREWQEKARRVESLGYQVFLVPDHFGDQFAPVPALLSAAEATREIRIGSLVFDNDFRHPALLAMEAATLDLLSGRALRVRDRRGLDEIGVRPGRDRVRARRDARRAARRGDPGDPVTLARRAGELLGRALPDGRARERSAPRAAPRATDHDRRRRTAHPAPRRARGGHRGARAAFARGWRGPRSRRHLVVGARRQGALGARGGGRAVRRARAQHAACRRSRSPPTAATPRRACRRRSACRATPCSTRRTRSSEAAKRSRRSSASGATASGSRTTCSSNATWRPSLRSPRSWPAREVVTNGRARG